MTVPELFSPIRYFLKRRAICRIQATLRLTSKSRFVPTLKPLSPTSYRHTRATLPPHSRFNIHECGVCL